ncbi:MAG: ABC transporter substrate-binding protein [Dehalococcoidia bacterium]
MILPLRAQISRRRLLASLAVLPPAAAGLAVFGCADSGDEGPDAGGTLRTGTTLPLSFGLDPHVEVGTGLAIFPRVYGYLLHVDPRDESLLLDHAASVEQPDETTIIVHLREDARFHEGSPAAGRAVTSSDAAASILRFRDNALAVSKTWHTTMLSRLETPDPQTLIVRTNRPYVYSLAALGGISGGAILPVESIEERYDFAQRGGGSGPYIARETEPRGTTRIARNAAYFRAPLPYLGEMSWTVFADDGGKLEAFARGEVDVIVNRDRVEAEETAALHADVEVAEERSLAWLSLGLRVDRPPFGDPRVREALDLALDRATLIRQLVAGDARTLGPMNAHLADGYWSPPDEEVAAAQSAALAPSERRARARTLLEEAGTAGALVAIQTPDVAQLRDVASAVRDQLGRVGLAAEVQVLPPLEWFVNFRSGRFESTLLSHPPYESPDLPARLYHSAGVYGDGNTFGFFDAEVDALVERSWGEADRAARRETLLAAQRLMLESRVMLQLFTGRGYTSARGYVRGRRPELPGSLAQYNHEQWIDDAARRGARREGDN